MVQPRDIRSTRDASRHVALLAGTTLSVAGTFVFAASAITMVILWILLLTRTMGPLGLVLGVSTSPVAVAYPFLQWIARGDFPLVVFGVWVSGIAGLAVTMVWVTYGRHRVSRAAFRAHLPHADEGVVPLRAEDGGSE
jgi:uncharacterized membrane protein